MSLKRMFAVQNINLPDLGEGTKEATIKEIYVKVGDTVEEYDDLCEVFTDKLVAKIPSSASGVITAINFGDDDICKVGHAIMTIEDGEGVQAAETPVEAAETVEPAKQSEPSSTQNSGATSGPAVRHLAK
jgi:2-oxoisovalerate dehydrogenase E2 component (dihydrolipoyl transacylase)